MQLGGGLLPIWAASARKRRLPSFDQRNDVAHIHQLVGDPREACGTNPGFQIKTCMVGQTLGLKRIDRHGMSEIPQIYRRIGHLLN